MTKREIENLISLKKKIIVEPLKSFKIEAISRKNGFKVKSVDGKHEFSVFLRQHTVFEENFSVGLIYHSTDGKKILLLRMNGPHGDTTNDPFGSNPNYGYHIHQIRTEEIEIENYNDPQFRETTQAYNSFDTAVLHFLKTTNIEDYTKHFPNFDTQYKLF